MTRQNLFPPEGMQDYLPDERWHKRRVEAQIRELFSLCGYDEIETPLLEYCDVVSGGGGRLPVEQLLRRSTAAAAYWRFVPTTRCP